MKKYLLLIAFLGMTSFSYSQTIVTNEKDEFNGSRIIQTDQTKIQYGGLTKPLVVISYGSFNNLVYLTWESRYVDIYVREGDRLYLLDSDGEKYDFYCISTNRKGYFKYIGDFSKIENKKIVKYRMESLNGNFDFDVDKKKTDVFSSYFVLIKKKVENYFPQGISPLGELILKLENTIDLQEKIRLIDALFLIKK